MERIEIDCEGGPIVIEADDDGVTIYGIDIEAERAAEALGFDPSPCLVALDEALASRARDGDAGVVEILLAAGADVHADDGLALKWAAEKGYAAIVELLLAAGADVHARYNDALGWAARNYHADVVQILEDWIEEHG